MLGEQGAESIHRRFNALNSSISVSTHWTPSAVRIVKERLISIAPDSIRAQPPPTKRAKRTPAKLKHVAAS